MKRPSLAFLLAVALSGCCTTYDNREAILIDELDEDVSCEELCAPPQPSDLELIECEFGETEERELAAICTYEYVQCPQHLL